MKTNLIIWVALLLISAFSFFLSESAQGHTAIALILFAAWLKATLLALHFMELRRAHSVWKAAMLALLLGILGAVYFFTTRT